MITSFFGLIYRHNFTIKQVFFEGICTDPFQKHYRFYTNTTHFTQSCSSHEGWRITNNGKNLLDNQSVWSIVCIFVAKEYRKQNVSTRLISAAVDYVKKQGGRIVEGYTVEPKKESMPNVFAYPGFYSAYVKAGFIEVARRSETRPIMRYTIES